MNKMAVFYHFYTPLHLGSGTHLSYVDLPVQREIHTGYPIMQSTGIKGVFRLCYFTNGNQKNSERLFGKNDEEGELIFTDGRILFFPVKSAVGVFVWITCPYVLERFKRDMSIVDFELPLNLANIEFNREDYAFVSSDNMLVNSYLILEELSFQKNNNVSFNWLQKISNDLDKDKIAIVSDNIFSYFVKNSTEVNARIRINYEKGVVEEGALWYEELVPAETVFYNLIWERKPESLEKFTNFVLGHNNSIFQFGGDGTLGRGVAKVVVTNRR